MANETTSSTISELYTEIVAEALFVASEQSVMRGLVRNYTIAGGGKSVEVPIFSTVSAAAVNEATDLSNTAVNPTSVTITASEVGIMTTLTDLARNSASRNVAADIGRLFGEAIATKIDTDLAALFTGFSTEKGPGAGSELTVQDLFECAAELKTITASEIGIMTTLTDLARNSSSRNIAADIGKLFGEAIAKKMDQDLTALFDGFSSSIGGAGQELTVDKIFQAVATLRQAMFLDLTTVS